jgi:hypothetical protein
VYFGSGGLAQPAYLFRLERYVRLILLLLCSSFFVRVAEGRFLPNLVRERICIARLIVLYVVCPRLKANREKERRIENDGRKECRVSIRATR